MMTLPECALKIERELAGRQLASLECYLCEDNRAIMIFWRAADSHEFQYFGFDLPQAVDPAAFDGERYIIAIEQMLAAPDSETRH